MATVFPASSFSANARARHHQRSAAAAERPAASQQAVALAQVAVGVEGDLHHVRLAGQRDAVERVDVFEPLDDRRCAG